MSLGSSKYLLSNTELYTVLAMRSCIYYFDLWRYIFIFDRNEAYHDTTIIISNSELNYDENQYSKGLGRCAGAVTRDKFLFLWTKTNITLIKPVIVTLKQEPIF